MQILLSPAKKLDFDSPATTEHFTQPSLLRESRILIKQLQDYSTQDIASLMGLSDNLAQLNMTRFQLWKTPFNLSNAKQAAFAFKGDVYQGLEIETFNKTQLKYAQAHIIILSGLYGILKPLDLMQAYRLEMGTKLENSRGKDLYAFWGNKVTDSINAELAADKNPLVVNLASNEYFKSVKKNDLEADIITPLFKDKKSGKYKIVSFYAKKARGLMAQYLVKQGAKKAEDIKGFDLNGYEYNQGLSEGNNWVFTRDVAP